MVTRAESIPEFSEKEMHRGLRMLSARARKARVATLDLGKPVGREAW